MLYYTLYTLYLCNGNYPTRIFKKEKTLHEQLMEGFDKEQYGTTEETDGTTD